MADHLLDISLAAQRARLLDALRCGPVSTLDARRSLDILQPVARVWELRQRYGHPIETVMAREATDCGKVHRVGRYFLQTEADHG